MAIVDIKTGKITGCKKNSAVWWHEKGHLLFNNSNFGATINYYVSFFQMFGLFFLSIGVVGNTLFWKVLGFCFALGVLISYFLEEAWCWGYALTKIYPSAVNKISNRQRKNETYYE